MYLDSEYGVMKFEGLVTLSPDSTRNEVFNNGELSWEGWPDRGAGGTLSYRAVFKINKNKSFGNIYLIVDFLNSDVADSGLRGWRFAPEKLLIGEQNKPEGKVTRHLREWFKEKTALSLPIYGTWGHIDAAYDPHNRTGTIVCNYRNGFKDERSWRDFCKWNKVDI